MPVTGNLTGTDPKRLTLTPGVYFSESSAQVTGIDCAVTDSPEPATLVLLATA